MLRSLDLFSGVRSWAGAAGRHGAARTHSRPARGPRRRDHQFPRPPPAPNAPQIGGLTLALHGIAHPVAYCEVDGGARAALRRLVAEGHLPPAPAVLDVRTLSAASLADAVAEHGGWAAAAYGGGVGAGSGGSSGPAGGCSGRSGGVDVIVAGFPCPGFSSAGKGEGFGHAGTALFSEVRGAEGKALGEGGVTRRPADPPAASPCYVFL